jgi:BA14K-like protein
MNLSSKIFAAALMAASAPWLVAPAVAAPISSPPGLQGAVAPLVETVQYRRGWRGGYRGGGIGGVGLGLAAGALIGGAIVGATRPYGYSGYDPDYGYAPGYGPGYAPGYGPGYVAADPYAGGNEVAYCQQRFRSYDPGSGTYLGFDGLRHPCP